jgi:hypothetical protein
LILTYKVNLLLDAGILLANWMGEIFQTEASDFFFNELFSVGEGSEEKRLQNLSL